MKYLYITILALLLSSCYPLVQKAYYVESPNVGAFDTTKQTNLNFSGQYFTHTNVQYSHSFNEHSGMFAGMHIGYQGWTKDNVNDSGLTNSFGLSAGYIWYKNIGKKYFEISTGYGFQTNTNILNDRKIQPGEWYSQHSNALFHRVIFQPSYVLIVNKNKIGLSLRNEFLYMPHYQYDFSVGSSEDPGYLQSNHFSDNVQFSDKFAVTHHLFFFFRNCRHKINWGFHAGVSFHSLMLKREYDFLHVGNAIKDDIPQLHPAMAAVVIGFDLGFNWKN
ncbi:hypothetical protein SDC9_129495 [bioreactor metagenome]|uniref:Uncharacterized protein n=1 Tax=bioreactor metagenome TaxID=1076179 RepID=A0A645CZN9_9ZZZZ